MHEITQNCTLEPKKKKFRKHTALHLNGNDGQSDRCDAAAGEISCYCCVQAKFVETGQEQKIIREIRKKGVKRRQNGIILIRSWYRIQ